MIPTSKTPNKAMVETGRPNLSTFYEKKNILITGSTGFIGKVFLLKLLHSLSNCGRVYVMLRPKKGDTATARFNKMLAQEPFAPAPGTDHPTGAPAGKEAHNLKYITREQLAMIDWSRVVPIEGDMRHPDLGIEQKWRDKLASEVEIVFNIAASVRFEAPLKENLEDNYHGTRNLLEMASKFPKLVSFVHVSTFYVNSHLSHIEERVLPMERDLEQTASLIGSGLKFEEAQLLESRPNSYVFTKAMAENLVKSYQGKLPIAIVRPSITIPSYREPFPGWVDNLNGPMGAYVVGSLGILRSFELNYKGVGDLIPVDFVVNTMLTVAERTPRLDGNEVKVYNCSTSSLNPLTWGQFFDSARQECVKAPPYKMLRLPIEVPKRSTASGLFIGRMSEILFAYFVDFIFIMCGLKLRLTRVTAKLHRGQNLLKFFSTTSYTCSNENLLAAYDELNSNDKREFNFNPKELDWSLYNTQCYFGTRRLLLKEDKSNIPASIKKMKLMLVAEFVLRAAFYALIVYSIYIITTLSLKQKVSHLDPHLNPTLVGRLIVNEIK